MDWIITGNCFEPRQRTFLGYSALEWIGILAFAAMLSVGVLLFVVQHQP